MRAQVKKKEYHQRSGERQIERKQIRCMKQQGKEGESYVYIEYATTHDLISSPMYVICHAYS